MLNVTERDGTLRIEATSERGMGFAVLAGALALTPLVFVGFAGAMLAGAVSLGGQSGAVAVAGLGGLAVLLAAGLLPWMTVQSVRVARGMLTAQTKLFGVPVRSVTIAAKDFNAELRRARGNNSHVFMTSQTRAVRVLRNLGNDDAETAWHALANAADAAIVTARAK